MYKVYKLRKSLLKHCRDDKRNNKCKDKPTSSILRGKVQERVWNHKDTPITSAFRGSVQERVWNVRGFTDPLGA